ncbi:30S ribosomal protein S8 [Candidatus Woesearchaeota archaeon]|nr:30S ribosomal protein S8 [Candidatus Woesearchaeota archaeon]
MLNDPLAAALAKIMNAEKVGKREVVIRPASKMLKVILRLMNEQNYLGMFEETDDGKGGQLKVHLLGNINHCGVIKPRFSTKYQNVQKWEKRYLPAKDFGVIFITTPKGITTHLDAKEKQTGGRLLAYVY